MVATPARLPLAPLHLEKPVVANGGPVRLVSRLGNALAYLLINALRAGAALSEATSAAGMSMGVPVRGLRPFRAFRVLTLNVPN